MKTCYPGHTDWNTTYIFLGCYDWDIPFEEFLPAESTRSIIDWASKVFGANETFTLDALAYYVTAFKDFDRSEFECTYGEEFYRVLSMNLMMIECIIDKWLNPKNNEYFYKGLEFYDFKEKGINKILHEGNITEITFKDGAILKYDNEGNEEDWDYIGGYSKKRFILDSAYDELQADLLRIKNCFMN